MGTPWTRPLVALAVLTALAASPGRAGVSRDRLPAAPEVDPGTGRGSPPVLVPAADGALHYLFHEQDQSLRYAVRRGARWEREVVDARYGFTGIQPMAVDAQGRVHAAWIVWADEPGSEPAVMYGLRGEGGWTLQELARGVPFWSGPGPVLLLDGDGRPRVVFENFESTEIASLDGESWSREPFGPPLQDRLAPRQVLLDDAGRFHVLAFVGPPGAMMMLYATDASGAWTIGTEWSVALALDPLGHPHIVTVADSGVPDAYDRMIHRWFDGVTWQVEQVLDSGTPLRERWVGAVQFDSAARLSLVFQQIEDPSAVRTAVARFAFRDGAGWRDLPLGRIGYPSPTAAVAADDAVHSVWHDRHARVALPDLAPDASGLAIEEAGDGVRVSGTLLVRNLGPGRSRAARVRFHLSDDDLLDAGDEPMGGPRSVPSLRPGGRARIPVDLRVDGPVSGRRLLAVVRPAGRPPDLDRTNDAAAIPLGVK